MTETIFRCYRDHDEDIRTQGSCGYCGSTGPEDTTPRCRLCNTFEGSENHGTQAWQHGFEPRLSPQTVAVGTGVTEVLGTDLHAATVTWVSASGETIRYTLDMAVPAEGYDFHANQTYEHEPVPVHDGVTLTAHWSETAGGFLPTASQRVLVEGRYTYRDPAF